MFFVSSLLSHWALSHIFSRLCSLVSRVVTLPTGSCPPLCVSSFFWWDGLRLVQQVLNHWDLGTSARLWRDLAGCLFFPVALRHFHLPSFPFGFFSFHYPSLHIMGAAGLLCHPSVCYPAKQATPTWPASTSCAVCGGLSGTSNGSS